MVVLLLVILLMYFLYHTFLFGLEERTLYSSRRIFIPPETPVNGIILLHIRYNIAILFPVQSILFLGQK